MIQRYNSDATGSCARLTLTVHDGTSVDDPMPRALCSRSQGSQRLSADDGLAERVDHPDAHRGRSTRPRRWRRRRTSGPTGTGERSIASSPCSSPRVVHGSTVDRTPRAGGLDPQRVLMARRGALLLAPERCAVLIALVLQVVPEAVAAGDLADRSDRLYAREDHGSFTAPRTPKRPWR